MFLCICFGGLWSVQINKLNVGDDFLRVCYGKDQRELRICELHNGELLVSNRVRNRDIMVDQVSLFKDLLDVVVETLDVEQADVFFRYNSALSCPKISYGKSVLDVLSSYFSSFSYLSTKQSGPLNCICSLVCRHFEFLVQDFDLEFQQVQNAFYSIYRNPLNYVVLDKRVRDEGVCSNEWGVFALQGPHRRIEGCYGGANFMSERGSSEGNWNEGDVCSDEEEVFNFVSQGSKRVRTEEYCGTADCFNEEL